MCCVTSNEVQKQSDWEYTQTRQRYQATGKKKEVTIDNIRVEVLQKAAVRDTCTKNRVRGARNGKSQKQTESSMGGIPQIS